jgi:hypothetical protein
MRVRFHPHPPGPVPEGRGRVVAPQDRGEGVYDVVAGAAQVAGAKADAVVDIDQAEHLRRTRCGLDGVETLGLLDALMCLPHGQPIPVSDIGEVALWHLRRAPEGCVEWVAGGCAVRRLLRPVASVSLVVVRAAGWRTGLRRAAAFEPFARRVVLLPRPGRKLGDYAWEADAAGTGLWATNPGGGIDEVVAPGEFVLRYVRPARWRFTERAYIAWLSANRP